MWSSIFSRATKVTKEVLVCVEPFRRKMWTKRRGVILPSPVIEVVRWVLRVTIVYNLHGPLPFWFQACQRTFRRVSTLRSHRKRCRGGLGVGSGANGENNQCSICHKIVRPERLNSHYAFEHVCKVLPVTQFFCPHDFIIDIREPVLSLVKLQFAIELF